MFCYQQGISILYGFILLVQLRLRNFNATLTSIPHNDRIAYQLHCAKWYAVLQ